MADVTGWMNVPCRSCQKQTMSFNQPWLGSLAETKLLPTYLQFCL